MKLKIKIPYENKFPTKTQKIKNPYENPKKQKSPTKTPQKNKNPKESASSPESDSKFSLMKKDSLKTKKKDFEDRIKAKDMRQKT